MDFYTNLRPHSTVQHTISVVLITQSRLELVSASLVASALKCVCMVIAMVLTATLQITGDVGAIVVMNVDQCDRAQEACSGSQGGQVPTFLINSAVISQVTSAASGTVPVAFRKVSCDMGSSTIGVMFGQANEIISETYFRLRGTRAAKLFMCGHLIDILVYGETVGIARVEVLGSALGATGGKWTALTPNVQGCFEYNLGGIGSPFQVCSPSSQVLVMH